MRKKTVVKMVTKPKTYTSEFVLAELLEMVKEIQDDQDIIYKGQLFERRDYTHQRLSEWAREFAHEPQISDTIRKIDKMLETRVVVGALTTRLSANMAKFHLINNFGWQDKTQVETNHTFSLTSLSDRAAQRRKELEAAEQQQIEP